MKVIKNLSVGLLVLFFVSSALNVVVFAQQPQSEEEKEMMKKWMEYATPGENHKYLEYFVGTWETSAKMWMKPGAPPEVSKGVTKSKMMLGGRYLKSYLKGSMMGMPFEGIALTGYDNFKKKFVTIWFDSAGTGFYHASGSLDKTSKTRTETGLWDDIMTGGKSKVKMVTKIIDDNKYQFDMYGEDPKTGKEFKSGEIIYTRKK
ncbi:MAG: DUF1579 domain-containing protein [Candidatus Aminicenantes bacterium]